MKSIEELRKLREQVKQMTALREDESQIRITVGMGTCGIAAGARETLNTFVQEIAARSIDNVVVTQAGCIGLCEKEPVVEVSGIGNRVLYVRVTAEKARRIITEHIQNGRVIEDWVSRN
ncbi:MAG: (2Fe-2S) ferredoxin domain-containing protein [bacterium]|nr:(2Fe-2S) ferredoxin domain-containing protein [bacterium]